MTQDGVEDSQQLLHARGQGQLLGLALTAQAQVDATHHGAVAVGDQRRHVVDTADVGALEFVRHVLPEGRSSGELPALKHGTEKYLLMEQGTLRARIGSQDYLLEEGDIFYFLADVPQHFENIGEGVCSYFVIKMQS